MISDDNTALPPATPASFSIMLVAVQQLAAEREANRPALTLPLLTEPSRTSRARAWLREALSSATTWLVALTMLGVLTVVWVAIWHFAISSVSAHTVHVASLASISLSCACAVCGALWALLD